MSSSISKSRPRPDISAAIEDFNKLFIALNNNPKSEIGRSFRARIREVISLILDVGLVPALSFFYAKCGKKIYDKITSENKETLNETDSTNKGYALSLYYILNRLYELKLLGSNEAVKNPIKAFEELENKQRVAFNLLLPYLIQLKRLSEAIFEEEGEGR